MYNKLKLGAAAVACAAVIALSGCSGTSSTSAISDAQAFGPVLSDYQTYETQLGQTQGEERINALVLAARSAAKAGDRSATAARAAELNSLAQGPSQQNKANLINALSLYVSGEQTRAEEYLKLVNAPALVPEGQIFYYDLVSDVERALYGKTSQTRYALNSYTADRRLYPLTSGTQRNQTLQRAVSTLQLLPEGELNALLTSSNDVTDRGFIEYALIGKSHSSQVREQLYGDFSRKYQDHPLNELLGRKSVSTAGIPVVGQETALPEVQGGINLKNGDKVAVLLPLSGRFAPLVGEPARLGIMAALTDRNAKLDVTFYDTAKIDLASLVQRLEANGTALILGPVLRPEVSALNATATRIPSIVLNVPAQRAQGPQWFFDLGPNYEGALAARKMQQDQLKSPAVFHTQAKDSQRAAASFKAVLDASGAQPRQCELNNANEAALRQSAAACNAGLSDGVYLPLTSAEALNVSPALGSVPLYLTDESYDGYNNSAAQMALRGAQLGDMPWLLVDSPLKASFLKSLPKANSQAQRVFAAAYDSVGVAFNFAALHNNRDDVLHGLTGDISLGRGGLLETEPLWVRLGQAR